MTPVIFALPFDETGLLPRNRVLREYHDLSKQAMLAYRTFVLDNGYFYTEGIEIQDSSGFDLKVDEDFQCIGLSSDVDAMKTGKEICSVIVILNPRVTQDVFVNASMVGGKFCSVAPAIADMSAGLLNPTRNPIYRNIEGKPDDFEVGGHLHAMWELFGFETFVDNIDRITSAKLVISARYYENIRTQFSTQLDTMGLEFDQLLIQLQQHLAAVNPHQVTKTQVGLSQVQNYPIATATEVATRGFNSKQRYLTVQRFKTMIDVNFISDLNAHIQRTDNPHRVTAAQAGTYTIPESESMLSTRLGLTEKAVSTYALDGYDWSSLVSYVKTNMDAAQITSGRVATARLTAAPTITSQDALVGGNQIVNIISKINQYAKRGTEIAWISGANGTNIAATLKASFADTVIWPAGSLALVMVYYSGSWGTGNGSQSRSAWRLQCWVKVDTVNWQAL